MSLTDYQRLVCRTLATERIERGERYIAGGAALNEIITSPRLSQDIDVFHDTREAVQHSWQGDRTVLLKKGFEIKVIREFPAFVEAEISMGVHHVILQWVQDSAFRFFPLIEHPDFALALHPLDLATNKVLALVGRAEVRDWVDMIHCRNELQSFGFLVWATCGKDPGLNPEFILGQASRSAHYTKRDIDSLAFDGAPPDISALSQTWREMLREADATIKCLPEEHIGQCALHKDGSLYRGNRDSLAADLKQGNIIFHEGTICGTWPVIKT